MLFNDELAHPQVLAYSTSWHSEPHTRTPGQNTAAITLTSAQTCTVEHDL